MEVEGKVDVEGLEVGIDGSGCRCLSKFCAAFTGAVVVSKNENRSSSMVGAWALMLDANRLARVCAPGGGGASSGGTVVGRGVDWIMLVKAFSCMESASLGTSRTIGTTSERNSRSSGERATLSRLLRDVALDPRENRPRNRDIVEAGGGSSSTSSLGVKKSRPFAGVWVWTARGAGLGG